MPKATRALPFRGDISAVIAKIFQLAKSDFVATAA
jgi:hypothetical protein